MAFVIESGRDLNKVVKHVVGCYNHPLPNKLQPSYAPFDSTSVRDCIFERKEVNPGPGYYQPSQPTSNQIIKIIDNPKNVIVQINSIGTSSFKSNINRFHSYQDDDYPGPGQYIYQPSKPTKFYTEGSTVYPKPPKIPTPKIKNYPSIPNRVKTLTSYQNHTQLKTQQPDYYDYKKSKKNNMVGTIWAKDKTKRFPQGKQTQLTHTKYITNENINKNKNQQPSYAYKSTTVRTYFDEILYDTKMSNTAEFRKESKYKSNNPGPGTYQHNRTVQPSEKPYQFQFFGSTVERFSQSLANKKQQTYYYDNGQFCKNKSFNQSFQAFLSLSPKVPSFLKSKNDVPGPGAYLNDSQAQKIYQGIKKQKFGSTEVRPFFKQQTIDELGPGKYQIDQQISKSPHQHNKNIMENRKSSTFKSTTKRNCFELKKGTLSNDLDYIPFAQYDVSQFQICKKLEKQKKFIQTLKMINYQKPSFQSSISRFPHYQQSCNQQIVSKNQQRRKFYFQKKNKSDKIRQKIIDNNKSQINKQRYYFSQQQRFKKSKKKAPPVGSYTINSNLRHKSYNVKFQSK